MAEGTTRPAWAEIDLRALADNVALLREVVRPAALCAVLKADAYGHGAVRVARAAVEAGVAGLAVAIVEEGVELREAGIVGVPILVLSEAPAEAAQAALRHRLTPTLYSEEGRVALEAARDAVGGSRSVHVKVDTGMHRVGLDPAAVADFVASLGRTGWQVEGLWSHLAVADGEGAEDRQFTALQLSRFEATRRQLAERGLSTPVHHVANSAGAIAHPSSRYELVRTGIALYGHAPSPWVERALAEASGGRRLSPVLSLKARVAALRRLAAGERPSYGRARPLPADSWVATVPLGYADGVARRLFDTGGEVLIGGRRRPLAGVVTMDQIVVDCGESAEVSVGDEVVLLGRQGAEEITAEEWAARLGTISYEVLTGIGPRVPRVSVGRPGPGLWRRLGAAVGPRPG